MSRVQKYTSLGKPGQQTVHEYDLLSEPLLSSELARLAEARTWYGTDCVTFQPCPELEEKSQDRYVVIDWTLRNGIWQFRGVFDGHAGHDTVDYVVDTLPEMIKDSLVNILDGNTEPTSEVVSRLLKESISSLDDGLTRGILDLFPDIESISSLSDEEIRIIVNDRASGGGNNAAVTRCMRGTTVLVSLVDPSRSNIWVASLGDCQAALGIQQPDEKWSSFLLSANHNAQNTVERDRMMQEHPGEPECVIDDRVLGAAAITRAVGDHLFKLPSIYTTRVFMNTIPPFMIARSVDEFLWRNKTPPYISSDAEVQHVRLEGREALLVMCSDGLLDLYNPVTEDLDVLANYWIHFLTRREKSYDSSNLALYLLRDAIGGEDLDAASQLMTIDLPYKWMDDTTILVQKL